MKAVPYYYAEDEQTIQGYSIRCEGCGELHHIHTNANTSRPGELWSFMGTLDKPTFNPAVNIRTGRFARRLNLEPFNAPDVICHFFIINGRIDYLRDCTHHLCGIIAELPEVGVKAES